MLQNKDIETLRMLFSSHNYVMTTAELTASKLYYADIKQLLDEGLIERVRRGYYHWTQDYGESEVVIINRLFPDAVFCMETALFYYRYSDRNPAEWNFAIDKNVSKRRTKIDYPSIRQFSIPSLTPFSFARSASSLNTLPNSAKDSSTGRSSNAPAKVLT